MLLERLVQKVSKAVKALSGQHSFLFQDRLIWLNAHISFTNKKFPS